MVCCAAASLVSTKNRGKARRAAIREVYSGRIGSPEKFRRVEHGLLDHDPRLLSIFIANRTLVPKPTAALRSPSSQAAAANRVLSPCSATPPRTHIDLRLGNGLPDP